MPLTPTEHLILTPRPEPEAVLNAVINAMHNCNTARMHLIAAEPYVSKVGPLVGDLESVFNSLRVIHQQLAKEQPNVAG